MEDFIANFTIKILVLLQMISSCLLLYVLRRWKIITFTVSESLTYDGNSMFVPLKTMIHTLPVAVTYLLYMVLVLRNCCYMMFKCFGGYIRDIGLFLF